MNVRFLKYLGIITAPIVGIGGFYLGGWFTWSLILYVFGIVPLVELFVGTSEDNLSKAEEEMVRADKIYDYLLYLIVPIQYGILLCFLYFITQPGLQTYEIMGMIVSMGIACGALGINVAHELGHRRKKSEQTMSKILLLSSLNMHFFIEHNRGHHKNVSTHEDPASARYGEMVYTFWFRSMIGEFVGAWRLANDLMRKKGLPVFSLHNEMIQFVLIEIAFVTLIALTFGVVAAGYFVIAAIIGILTLETVNYIEHYGLQRKKNEHGVYESVLPVHSWNSNHVIGRILLFELSRHSDHHYRASRKYQVLRHFDEAPQMPTGYPGMMLLSLVPPLWFYVMHNKIERLKTQSDMAHALA